MKKQLLSSRQFFYFAIFFLLLSLFQMGCKKESSNDEPNQFIIPETTKIIDQDTWTANIKEIDSSESVFVFNQNLLSQVNLKKGDIFISADGHGYLKKVTNIRTEGNEIIAETAFASLAEAVQSGNFSISFGLSKQKIAKINYLRPGVTIDNSIKTNSNEGELKFPIDTYLNKDSTIHVEGEFSITPDISCGVEIDWFSRPLSQPRTSIYQS